MFTEPVLFLFSGEIFFSFPPKKGIKRTADKKASAGKVRQGQRKRQRGIKGSLLSSVCQQDEDK
jgi:hypothetical protein